MGDRAVVTGRWEGHDAIAQLDRFYVSDLVVGRGGQSSIMPRMTLSDHAPVILTFANSLAPHSCRIPDSIYTREEVHSRLISMAQRVGCVWGLGTIGRADFDRD